MHNIVRMAGAAVVAAAALLATFTPAQAASGRLGTALSSNMCLDVPGSNIFNGQNLQIHYCSSHIAQRFEFLDSELQPAGDDRFCVEIADSATDPGPNVRLWECNGTRTQQWIWDGNAGAFKNLNAQHLCLDVAGGSAAAGTRVISWHCSGGAPQRWHWK